VSRDSRRPAGQGGSSADHLGKRSSTVHRSAEVWPPAWWTASLPRRRRRYADHRVRLPKWLFQFAASPRRSGRPSTPDEQARFAQAVSRLGVDYVPDRRGWQTVRCPFPEHHSNGDRHPSARLLLDGCALYCHVAARLWLYRDLVEPQTTAAPITATRSLVEHLAALPTPAIAQLLPDAAVAKALKTTKVTARRRMTAARRVQAVISTFLELTDEYTTNVHLRAADLYQHAGVNPRYHHGALELAEHIGFTVAFGESGRTLGRLGTGRIIANRGHLRATLITADPDRLARTLATARKASSVNALCVGTTCPPSTYITEYLPNRPSVAHHYEHGPLHGRPALARTLDMLLDRRIEAVSVLADIDGCPYRTMNDRLRQLAKLGLVKRAGRGIVAVTRSGDLVYDEADECAHIQLDNRVAEQRRSWQQARREALDAWLNRPPVNEDDGIAPPHTDADYHDHHDDRPIAGWGMALGDGSPAATGEWQSCVDGDCDDRVDAVAGR